MECCIEDRRCAQEIQRVSLGTPLSLAHVIAVARYGAAISFESDYEERVLRCRKAVDDFSLREERVYGVTTGLGENWNCFIPEADRAIIQKNHVLSHSCSVGEPLEDEIVRAMMVVMLQHFGSGHTGMGMEPLRLLAEMLNRKVTPVVPAHGTVGYICHEAHIGTALIGEGKCKYKGHIKDSNEALREAGLQPVVLRSKEGLTLVSGTTAVTAFASLALYDALKMAITADIAGAMSLEVLKGTLQAMDERVHLARPHAHQISTAANIRRLLADSPILKRYRGHRIQDALSLRCIPQLHGAAKKILAETLQTLTTELNSSVDNPLLFATNDDKWEAVMACNADGSYVGLACDCAVIALTDMMKMAERRIDRTVNHHVSELPPFLSVDPGLNDGLMIPQYAAAGLLGELKLLSVPATVDNAVTCANQEDYTSMGGNAAIKFYRAARLSRYILAIELLNDCQALEFYADQGLQPSSASQAVYQVVRHVVPAIKQDRLMSPQIESVASLVDEGNILAAAERSVGALSF